MTTNAQSSLYAVPQVAGRYAFHTDQSGVHGLSVYSAKAVAGFHDSHSAAILTGEELRPL